VTWDAGGTNSYRMGAEGKYDLQLSPNHDPQNLRPIPVRQDRGCVKVKTTGVSVSDKVKVIDGFTGREIIKKIFLLLLQQFCLKRLIKALTCIELFRWIFLKE
jgi:hypothetical protein